MAAGKYRITQDQWCWCGQPAAFIVEEWRRKRTVERVCSFDHGRRAIERMERIDQAGKPQEKDEGEES